MDAQHGAIHRSTAEELGKGRRSSETLKVGQIVYSRRLYWSVLTGPGVAERYGREPVRLGYSNVVKVKRSTTPTRCCDCEAPIAPRSLYASNGYADYCCECISATRPMMLVDQS